MLATSKTDRSDARFTLTFDSLINLKTDAFYAIDLYR